MIAAIDFSMSSPALVIGATGSDFASLQIVAFKDKKRQKSNYGNLKLYDYPTGYTCDVERFNLVTNILMREINDAGVTKVFIEGYAYGASGNTYTIGECTGLLKYKLWQDGIDLDVFQPSEIKKFATGKGNANKFAMLEFFAQECGGFSIFDAVGEEVKSDKIPAPITDIVDAYFIWKLGDFKSRQLQTS